MQTVILPDGYNGKTEVFNAEPLEVNGNVAKLCVANTPWLIRFILVADLNKAIQEQSI